jgi:leucyl-tRNA synthetase
LYFNKQLNSIAPNMYIGIGGSDHAVSHLLYSRFMTKVLRDFNMINLNEPFPCLITHGLILNNAYKGKISGKYYAPKDVLDGCANYNEGTEEVEVITNCKMSKSLKNGISIEDALQFGVNAVRLYILSDNPIIRDMTWNEDALRGSYRFVNKVWTVVNNLIDSEVKENDLNTEMKINVSNHLYHLNRYMNNLEFNLYVARLRMLFNYMEEISETVNIKNVMKNWLIALFPICPSLADKCFSMLYNSNIQNEEWIDGKEKKTSILVIQINGKKYQLLDTIEIKKENEEKEINEIAQRFNIKYKKYIHIPNKLINFVT